MVNHQIASLERQADRALDDMEMATGVPMRALMIQRPRPQPIAVHGATFNSINITDSNVGVVNTGQLTQVDTAIGVIGRQGNQRLASALKSLTEAVMVSAALAAPSKKEAVEILSALSTEATAPSAHRKRGVARALMARLKEILSVGVDIAEVTQTTLDVIATAFAGG